MKNRFLVLIFILIDWISAVVSWAMFYYFRKILIENKSFSLDHTFFIGVFFVPIIWLILFMFQGTYYDVRRLYRLKTFSLTFVGVLIGTTFLFFTLLLDDEINGYQQYYRSYLLLFGIYFCATFIPRIIFVSFIVNRVQKNKSGFRTLLIGGDKKAVSIYNEIINLPKGIGNQFVGYVNLNGVDRLLDSSLNYLGHIDKLDAILRENQIEEVIIALENSDHEKLRSIISRIEGGSIKIKISPDMYDILLGSVKMNNLFGALLFEVNSDSMPIWQQIIKRVIDFVVSLISIIVLIPFYIIMSIVVKLSSDGPVFFLQERVGLNGVPFNIIKFRTMYINSEQSGPQLSSEHDPRITKPGRIMRKLRLDEFPQFFNVLKGEMSLVGPRPERQFYIDQIVKVEPQFTQLTKVLPGITSWGQVKFGYAENVEQMIQRMKFDLLYLKNRTLSLDLKIMLITLLIIIKAKGK
jgi:exopolysaccharide biosynthesis polyprenyl glycosylphosphotransferase